MDIRGLFIRHRTHLYFLVRYGISGALGGLTQVVVIYLWVSVLGLQSHYLWGAVVGFAIALVQSFAMQKYWTFRDHSHDMVGRQIFFYVLASLFTLGLTTVLLHTGRVFIENLGYNYFHIWYLVVQVCTVLIAAVFSFSANWFITFRRR